MYIEIIKGKVTTHYQVKYLFEMNCVKFIGKRNITCNVCYDNTCKSSYRGTCVNVT